MHGFTSFRAVYLKNERMYAGNQAGAMKFIKMVGSSTSEMLNTFGAYNRWHSHENSKDEPFCCINCLGISTSVMQLGSLQDG